VIHHVGGSLPRPVGPLAVSVIQPAQLAALVPRPRLPLASAIARHPARLAAVGLPAPVPFADVEETLACRTAGHDEDRLFFGHERVAAEVAENLSRCPSSGTTAVPALGREESEEWPLQTRLLGLLLYLDLDQVRRRAHYREISAATKTVKLTRISAAVYIPSRSTTSGLAERCS